VILLTGIVSAACLCGTLGIIAAYVVYNFKVGFTRAVYSLCVTAAEVVIVCWRVRIKTSDVTKLVKIRIVRILTFKIRPVRMRMQMRVEEFILSVRT